MATDSLKILHISNGFCTSKVHSNLCRALDKKVGQQVVYTYIDDENKVGKNKFKSERTSFVYDCILNSFVRKIYPLRVWWTSHCLEKRVNLADYNCIFATTLFSDGGVANRLYKKYNIPYIVAVRATDLTAYLKSKIYWGYGREILLNAKRIILINKANEERLRTLEFSRPIWDKIKDKIVIRPNGIDSYWLDHIHTTQSVNKYRICYVGTFIPRKNVLQLAQAVEALHAEFPEIRLDLVGSGGASEQQVRKFVEGKPYIHMYGQISDKDKLVGIYRNNAIFAMPSLYETFGLVYIEALTQNLRLLYTKGTGIDGLLDNVGEAVESPSVERIANGLRKLIKNYGHYDGLKKMDFSYFDWDVIADQYIEMFNSIIDKK